jgi:hypothetical protein
VRRGSWSLSLPRGLHEFRRTPHPYAAADCGSGRHYRLRCDGDRPVSAGLPRHRTFSQSKSRHDANISLRVRRRSRYWTTFLRTRDRSVRPTQTTRIWNFVVCSGVGPRGSFAEHGDVHGRKSASGPWRGSRAGHSTSDYHRSLSRTRGSETVFGVVTGHDDRTDRCAAYWRAFGRRDGVAGDFLVPSALWRCIARGSAQDRARDAGILTPCDCGPPRHLARLCGPFQTRQASVADPFKRFRHGGAVCLYRIIVVWADSSGRRNTIFVG